MDEKDFSTLPLPEKKEVQKPSEVASTVQTQPAAAEKPVQSAVGPAALKTNLPEPEKKPSGGGAGGIVSILIILGIITLVIIGLGAATYFGYIKLPGIDLGGLIASILGKQNTDDAKIKYNALSAITSAKNAIDRADKIGADTSLAKEQLKNAEDMLAKSDYKNALSNANDAVSTAKKAEQEKAEEDKKKSVENEMPPPLPDEI